MREKPRDKERLKHMIEAIDNIFELTNGKSFDVYRSEKMFRFAVIWNILIVGVLITLNPFRLMSPNYFKNKDLNKELMIKGSTSKSGF